MKALPVIATSGGSMAQPVAVPEFRLPPLAKGKNINILAINPASIGKDRLPLPPLGILYIAAFARQRGYANWRFIDNDVTDKQRTVSELAEEIAWADVVALTGTTAQCRQAIDLAVLAKSMDKIVVYGGPHASPTWKETLERVPSVDFVAKGEGEETFTELLEALTTGGDLANIAGLAFRHPNGEIILPRTRRRNFGLDELPLPARDLLDMGQYGRHPLKRFSGEGFPYVQIIMGRGCTDKCVFCNTPGNWGGPVVRSAANLFAEMLEVWKTYRIKMFHFQDDVFTVNKPIVRELCRLMLEERANGGPHFEWSCLVRPDQFDYELVCLMRDAGCVQLEIGVESGSDELLASARKRYNTDTIRRAFDDAHRAGVAPYAFFIIGLPGETVKTWRQSVQLAREIKPAGSVWTVLCPFPGTQAYDQKMVEILDPDYSNWLYKRPVIRVGNLGPWQLMRMRNAANNIVNGRGYSGAYRSAAPPIVAAP
ncbi:MAG: B12-binding domain-containing radical SAM protein [Candidatus Yanofskybacteria bacterium]|nr:B12-binding domain-containing radical SAM protein [Candidatus Yanofskybacteria bacterium]